MKLTKLNMGDYFGALAGFGIMLALLFALAAFGIHLGLLALILGSFGTTTGAYIGHHLAEASRERWR